MSPQVNDAAFRALHREAAIVPARHLIDVPAFDGDIVAPATNDLVERNFLHPAGCTLFKPAYITDKAAGSLGVKVVSVRPRNAQSGRPTVMTQLEANALEREGTYANA